MTDLRRTAPVLLLVALVALVLAVPTGFSSAAFTSRSTATATVASGDWIAPVVRVVGLSEGVAGTVPVQVEATDEHGSGVASVVVEYRLQGAAAWTRICEGTSAPWSCSWATSSVPDGRYELRATATDRAGLSAVSGLATTTVVNTNTLVLDHPGSTISGTTTLAARLSVLLPLGAMTIQYAPAGTDRWTDVCSRALTRTVSCSWDTTKVADGSYDLRAVYTGLLTRYTSNIVRNVAVRNVATVTVTSPKGSIGSTATFAATAYAPAGITSITYQARSKNGNQAWVTICTVTAAPWSCAVNLSGKLSNGANVVRAIMLDKNGVSTTSPEPHPEFQVGGNGGSGSVSTLSTTTSPSSTTSSTRVLAPEPSAPVPSPAPAPTAPGPAPSAPAPSQPGPDPATTTAAPEAVEEAP